MYGEIHESDYKHWLNLPWKTSRKGNQWVIYDEFRITVFDTQSVTGLWTYCI